MLLQMSPRRRLLPLLIASLLTVQGAQAAEGGWARFAVPKQLSDAYSEVELRAMLVIAGDGRCAADDCDAVRAFRARVGDIGGRLAAAAREAAPALGVDVPEFVFLVPEADELGLLSSATGTIVVFDGVRRIDADDTALAFLIARDMGHVLAGHHEENSATQLVISALATLALPVLNLLRGAAVTLSTATTLTATTAAATAATTVASMAGVHMLKSIYRPDQLREADGIALKLMETAGWRPAEIAESLARLALRLQDEGWGGEVLISKARLDMVAAGPPWPLPTPIADTAAQMSVAAADETVADVSAAAPLPPLPTAPPGDGALVAAKDLEPVFQPSTGRFVPAAFVSTTEEPPATKTRAKSAQTIRAVAARPGVKAAKKSVAKPGVRQRKLVARCRVGLPCPKTPRPVAKRALSVK